MDLLSNAFFSQFNSHSSPMQKVRKKNSYCTPLKINDVHFLIFRISPLAIIALATCMNKADASCTRTVLWFQADPCVHKHTSKVLTVWKCQGITKTLPFSLFSEAIQGLCIPSVSR